MGLLDKVKNLFTEEVEVEVEDKPKKKSKTKERPKIREVKEEPIQKEVIKVEIPSPKEKRESRVQMYDFEENEKSDFKEKKDDYKFPFFDDDDFDTIEVKPKPKKEETIVKPEIYNPPREEKKVFKPSPIISPVYGFLDKDYQKEEILKKPERQRRATVDEIRDRAFGSLEEDIENNIFESNRMTFDDDNKPKSKEKIDDDLTDLLEAEMSLEDEKPKTSKAKINSKTNSKKKDKPRKISDKELFSLIDSMYEGEIK